METAVVKGGHSMDGFEKDEACISWALTLWANHIETGNVSLTQDDVIRTLQSMPDDDWHKRDRCEAMSNLKQLTQDQKAFVARLRALANKARQS